MSREYFENRIKEVTENYESVIYRKNEAKFSSNGVFNRYEYPVVTRESIPLGQHRGNEYDKERGTV